MKLTIGSVQFGLPYGISNVVGQVTPCEVEKILNVAQKYNVDMIDTAIAYGDSESVLGLIGVNDFKVITKSGRYYCRRNKLRNFWVMRG